MSVRGVGLLEEFKQPLARGATPPQESNPRFWNPSRAGVRFAPDEIRNQLHAIDEDLDITWDNYNERWVVWHRNPNLKSALNRGWSLLFILRYADQSYMPLDQRVFARIYEISANRWGNAKKYFDAVEREWERDREKATADRNEDVKHSAGDYYDYMQIKNIGSGSKFATHWS